MAPPWGRCTISIYKHIGMLWWIRESFQNSSLSKVAVPSLLIFMDWRTSHKNSRDCGEWGGWGGWCQQIDWLFHKLECYHFYRCEQDVQIWGVAENWKYMAYFWKLTNPFAEPPVFCPRWTTGHRPVPRNPSLKEPVVSCHSDGRFSIGIQELSCTWAIPKRD